MKTTKFLHTLRGRYMIVIFLTVLSGMVLISLVSFDNIKNVVQIRGKDNMVSSVSFIGKDMEREYYDLLRISQHMMPSGRIGIDLQDVLTARTNYDLGEAKRALSQDMVLVTFSGLQSELATYIDKDDNAVFATTMSVKKDFDTQTKLPLLLKSNQIVYNAIHTSQSQVSNQPVISISREGVFDDLRTFIIYVEIRTSTIDSLQSIEEKSGFGYGFLMLDDTGNVRYSNNDDFVKGDRISFISDSDEIFGFSNQYAWAKAELGLGFSCVLLQHKSDFFVELLQWLSHIIIALVISILLLVACALLMQWLIYQKIQMMFKAIDRIGHDTLEFTEKRTGLLEFDGLMDRVDVMSKRIRQLIMDVETKESERAKIELEKLFHQINPHFVMNSLNSVQWLARMRGQERIREMVHQLTTILSYSLGRSIECPTLRDELDVLKEYIALESTRHTFTVTYDIEQGEYLDAEAPRLILQPLVENSIGHGMQVGGHLSVQVYEKNGGAVIIIADNGCGLTPQQLQELNDPNETNQAYGIGLRYVRRMMEQFYHGNAGITFESIHGQSTTVTMVLGSGGNSID